MRLADQIANEDRILLQSVARVIRMDLGIRAFTVDMGGWDTHENQPPRLAALVGQLSRAMGANLPDANPSTETYWGGA